MSRPEVGDAIGEGRPRRRVRHLPAPWLLPAGALIGFVGSMCGIGGGLFAVPLLHLLFGMELRRAVATSLVLVLATSSMATVTELLHSVGELPLVVVAELAAGALVGTQIGYRASRRIDAHTLRQIFVVVLFAAGAWLLARVWLERGGTPEVAHLAALDLEPWRHGAAVGIGFAGGVVAPLLGIGGGLVFVPALYFCVPELGFYGARACSLAAATVTALRSNWLYLREDAIDAGRAAFLGIGALVGAVSGVFAVRQPGAIDAARALLAMILWLVAMRFLRAIRDEGRARRGARRASEPGSGQA